ncbi:uncharacterized protein PHACADRAFT_32185 [Phanerochaete carnosa HHB-10118-sp]|uniref:Uncharacterized protein n=1 Tax=Phanerochaete carnosa (strain HHB-10118-sp) TaxID=650164 RepID=K5VX40_PHACS|nr:uncharacterized protein PHACADRAFT_32185 [Phanerochaete carnosa HHB-10118-sp]EKM51174.1 hypothetical protein PHACADRAFT_32185 [Phanerochaete carnosa HHB-10118-sp]
MGAAFYLMETGFAVIGAFLVCMVGMGSQRYIFYLCFSDHDIMNGSRLYWLEEQCGGGGHIESSEAQLQGFAAGGQIVQKIVRDPLHPTAYNLEKGSRLHITILDPISLARLTGKPPISTPISISTYINAKLPWFDSYQEGVPTADDTSGDHRLADVKSLQVLLSERRD